MDFFDLTKGICFVKLFYDQKEEKLHLSLILSDGELYENKLIGALLKFDIKKEET